MATYVYICSKHKTEHPEQIVVHRMLETPDLFCEVCGSKMHKKPMPFKFYMNPTDTLYEMMDEEYIKARKDAQKRKKGRKNA